MTLIQSNPEAGHTLVSLGGLTLRAIAYGATVTHLCVPDRDGRLADVVLGFAVDDEYHRPHPYFGVTAGRVAGRITGARFTLDGQTHNLAANDPPNHLHGGNRGFDKQAWEIDGVTGQSIRFSRTSPHGEEGYPGRVRASVTYSVTPDNAFCVDFEATTDRATPFSLTHHSYFNLAGEDSGESIEGHDLQIVADTYAPTDSRMGLVGLRAPVNAGNDFTQARRLGDTIPHLFAGHGDLYFIRRETVDGDPVLAARLSHSGSGRVMTVYTTESCIQLYTGMGLDGTLRGKSGRPYAAHAGLCLECEGYPDGANVPELGDIILRPGQRFKQRTIYAFSTL